MLLLFGQLLRKKKAPPVIPPPSDIPVFYGGGGAGATWEGWNDGETDADTIRLKNAQIINIVAAMVTSGILSCH